jgi:hypothetical protein
MLSALATARRIRVSLCSFVLVKASKASSLCSFVLVKASKASKLSTCYQCWPPLCVRAVNVLRVAWHLQVPHHLHARYHNYYYYLLLYSGSVGTCRCRTTCNHLHALPLLLFIMIDDD